MMARHTALFLPLVVTALALPVTPVRAHGDVRSSTPAEGSSLRRPPESVLVRLAEPPAQGSDLVVTDGCRRQVSGRSTIVATSNLQAPVSGGQPGRWNVKVRFISSVDDHLVKESFPFTVRGEKDCSPQGSAQDPDDDVELGDPQPPIENDETSFPVVPFALGTGVLIVVAIALRRSKS